MTFFNQEAVTVVMAIDENMAMPLGVTLHTMLRNASEGTEFVIWVFEDRVSRSSKNRISRILEKASCETTIFWMDLNLDSFFEGHLLETSEFLQYVTRSAYLRVFAPEIIPSDAEKIIYLDADTIVLADVSQIWQLPIPDDNVCLAVQDYCIPRLSSNLAFSGHAEEMGLPGHKKYFNAGLLVIDLEKWHRYGIFQKTIDMIQGYGEFFDMNDQDALNSTLYDRWEPLPPLWNVQLSGLISNEGSMKIQIGEQDCDVAIDDVNILHYSGREKPWNLANQSIFNNIFVNSLKRSGWFSHLEYMAWLMGARGRQVVKVAKDRSRPYRKALRRGVAKPTETVWSSLYT